MSCRSSAWDETASRAKATMLKIFMVEKVDSRDYGIFGTEAHNWVLAVSVFQSVCEKGPSRR